MEYYNFNALEDLAEDVSAMLIKKNQLKLIPVTRKLGKYKL